MVSKCSKTHISANNLTIPSQKNLPGSGGWEKILIDVITRPEIGYVITIYMGINDIVVPVIDVSSQSDFIPYYYEASRAVINISEAMKCCLEIEKIVQNSPTEGTNGDACSGNISRIILLNMIILSAKSKSRINKRIMYSCSIQNKYYLDKGATAFKDHFSK